MLVPMAKARIIGPKRRLSLALEELHKLGLVQPINITQEQVEVEPLPEDARRAGRADELRFLISELEALLELLSPAGPDALQQGDLVLGEVDAGALRARLDELAPRVRVLTRLIDELHNEQIVLPRYIEPLRRLLPLVPELADFGEQELRVLQLKTVVLVLNTEDVSLIEMLRQELAERVGARFELVHTRIEEDVTGCVLIFPENVAGEVRGLLGQERVRHVALPPEYESLSLSSSVTAMERRLAELPAELAAAQAELEELLRPHEGEWRTLHAALRAELEQLDVVALLGGTQRTFVTVCWAPRPDLPRLRRELEQRVGDELVLEELPFDPRAEEAPVIMHNPRLARPFEFLVRFLDLPRSGSFDPTLLVALFLPLMFGAMVGDVGYGVILLALAILARRFARRTAVVNELDRVLLVGSAWAILFGFLYGELFGDLGKRLGMRALWLHRSEADALEPLLLFALGIGAAHVVLGLLLGAWQALRFRQRGRFLDKLGTLLVLGGLFGAAGVAADMLPEGVITPAAATVLVGLVLVVALHSALDTITALFELVGTLGNLLSYLRIAAVGLASAYLAIVANELAVAAPLWLGMIVAAFLHALNVLLAGFTPMIQALRLHYVEFFGKFYEGGGRPFKPFGVPPTTYTGRKP